MHEARTDFCMLLGLIAILLLGAGILSLDRCLSLGERRPDVPENASNRTAVSRRARGAALEGLLVFSASAAPRSADPSRI